MRIDEFVFGKKNTSDATAKVKQYVQKNKAELNKGQDEKVGGTIGKIAAGSLARDTNVAAQRERNVGLDAFGGTGADKTPTPMDAGEFADTPVAKPTAVAKPNTPPPGTLVAKTDQEAYGGDPSAHQDAGSGDREAYSDPSVLDDTIARIKANAGMKDSEYKTSQGSKRTARDMALDKQYPYKAPDGRRLKYPHGDLRNLFEPSPDTRKAGSDVVVRDGKRKKSWKNPNTSTSQNAFRSDDDRK